MTFFYDLNKRLADLASKQDLHESKVAESEKWIQKAVNPATKGNLHKALHVAQGETIPKAKIAKATHSKNPKLRHMAQFAKNVANEGQCPKCAPAPCSCNEGNAFTDKLKATAKGGKFKMGNKEYTDTSDIEEDAFKNLDIERQEQEIKKSRHNPGNSPLRQVPGVQNIKPRTKENPLKNVGKGFKAFVKGEPEPMDEVVRVQSTYYDKGPDSQSARDSTARHARDARAQARQKDPTARGATSVNKPEVDNGWAGTPGVTATNLPANAPRRLGGLLPGKSAAPANQGKGVAENTSSVSDKEIADLIHDIAVHLIFNKQKMSINEANPKLVATEVQKAYKMEGIPFGQSDLTRVQHIFPKVMRRLRKGFAPEVKDSEDIDEQGVVEEKKAKPDYPDIDHDGNRKESMKKAAADKTRSTGTAFDPEARKKSKTDQEGTGNFDKKKVSTGTVYTRRHKEDDEEVTSNEPKRKGRPKGPAKGPERTTAKAWKHKGGRAVKENDIAITDRGEYDDEAGMAKDQLHTIVRHAQELERALGAGDNLPEWVQEKMGQIKGMMTSVTDYMLSQKERGIEQHTGREGITLEKAPPGAKAERMVKGIKKSLSKDGNLSGKDKAIAYATTWKAHNQGKVEEESTDKKDQHAERAGRRVAKDIEYDEKKKDGIHGKRRGSEDNKAEKAGRQVAKDIEYDEKHKKVKETTSGSVASAPAKATTGAGGMTFGKGVYEGAVNESYERKLKAVLNEGMNVTVNMNAEGQKSVNVSADGEDAEKLAEILKLAGLGGQSGGCSSCGQSSCGCETVDEAYGDATATKNSTDWPTDTKYTSTRQNMDPVSNDLVSDKSTGQTTVPVIAGQRRRMSTMEENVELERSLFKTWKTYKG